LPAGRRGADCEQSACPSRPPGPQWCHSVLL
jgi:hypothetical protein